MSIATIAAWRGRHVTLAADIDWQTFGLGLIVSGNEVQRVISLHLGPVELWAAIDLPERTHDQQ